MSRSRVALILSLAIWVSLAGCSSERPTRPRNDARVPTANLSDHLMLKQSEVISGQAGVFNDTAGLYIPLPKLVLDQFGSQFEIHLSHYHNGGYRGYLEFGVYLPESGDWLTLDDPGDYRGGILGQGLYGDYRFLSVWGTQSMAEVIDTRGRLKVRGTFEYVDVRLAVVEPSYAAELLDAKTNFGDITWSDGSLILKLVTRHTEGRIEWRDASGAINHSANSGGYWHQIMRSGPVIWTLSRNDGLTLLSDIGTPLGHARLQWPDGGGVDWDVPVLADGQIWLTGAFGQSPNLEWAGLIGFDPWKSIDSGYTVYSGRREWPRRLMSPGDIEWGSGIFHVLEKTDGYYGLSGFDTPKGHIFTVSSEGEILDSLLVPVNARDIAWDGEAYWMVHYGPPELPSTDLLLSRFYPR